MPLPSDIDTVKVYGKYVDFNGSPRSGTFTFVSQTRVRSAAQHTAITPSTVTGILDGSGNLKAQDGTSDLLLVATDDADGSPTGWTWAVTETITGLSPRTYNLNVPLSAMPGGLDLTGAATDVPPVNPSVTAVTQVNAKNPDSSGHVTLTAADIPAAAVTHVHSGSDITTGTVAYARHPVGTSANTLAAGDDSRITSAVQPSRTITAGTGLTGGGDLSANRTLSVVYGTTSTTAARGDDARLSDARTPTSHVHDAAAITTGTIDVARIPVGTTSTDVAAGNDTRIVNAVPNSRTITAGTGLTGGGALSADRTLAVSYGTTAGTAAQGNDSRLSDSRTPTTHAASHASGGTDPITPAAIGAEVSGAATAAIATHLAAGDPHPQYLTPTEGNAAYAAISHTHTYADVTGVPINVPYSITGAVAVATGKGRWYNDTGRTLSIKSVRASVGTAPVGSSLTIALKKDAVAVTGATASIAAGDQTAKTTVTGQTIADGSYLTIDVTAVGSSTPGSDLTALVVLS